MSLARSPEGVALAQRCQARVDRHVWFVTVHQSTSTRTTARVTSCQAASDRSAGADVPSAVRLLHPAVSQGAQYIQWMSGFAPLAAGEQSQMPHSLRGSCRF